MTHNYQDKFVGYVDILGFKQLILDSADGTGMALSEVLKLLESFGSPNERNRFADDGPRVCPESNCHQRNLDFRLTQISDCMIVSSEVSPVGVINLISHCSSVILRLLEWGRMCRGYITRGAIYHTDTQILGPAYQDAYSKESEVVGLKKNADQKGSPFVEIDPMVRAYLLACEDKCVKEMFSRLVICDGDFTAIFPFHRLAHSFAIGGFSHTFDANREKESNHNVRLLLERFKQGVKEHVAGAEDKTLRKADCYLKALDEQLAVCDRTDKFIDAMNAPIPRRT